MPHKRVPDPWPWPADTQLDRARRVAQSYREALRTHLPELCSRLDEHMVSVGQTWVKPKIVQYELMDLLDAKNAADYCGVKLKTIYQWRYRGLEVTDTPDGPRYRVDRLIEYQAKLRARRGTRSA